MKVELELTVHDGFTHIVFESRSEFTHQMWRKTMRTYTIELRVDYQDNEKYDIMLEAMRTMARDTMATALMLKDKRDPQVAFSSSDMFSKDESLELITPEEATTQARDMRGE
jgi:hypothetical protein